VLPSLIVLCSIKRSSLCLFISEACLGLYPWWGWGRGGGWNFWYGVIIIQFLHRQLSHFSEKKFSFSIVYYLVALEAEARRYQYVRKRSLVFTAMQSMLGFWSYVSVLTGAQPLLGLIKPSSRCVGTACWTPSWLCGNRAKWEMVLRYLWFNHRSAFTHFW
jgi:hypothetical protein